MFRYFLVIVFCVSLFYVESCFGQSRTHVVVKHEIYENRTDTIFGSIYLNHSWSNVWVTSFKTRKEYKFPAERVISILSHEGFFLPFDATHKSYFAKRIIHGDVSLFEYVPEKNSPAVMAASGIAAGMVGGIAFGLLINMGNDYFINSNTYPELQKVRPNRKKIAETLSKYFEENGQVCENVKAGLFSRSDLPDVIYGHNSYLDENWVNDMRMEIFIATELIVFRVNKNQDSSPVTFMVNDVLIEDFEPNSAKIIGIIDANSPCTICFGEGFDNCLTFDLSEEPDVPVYIECSKITSDAEPSFEKVPTSHGQFEYTKRLKLQKKRQKN